MAGTLQRGTTTTARAGKDQRLATRIEKIRSLLVPDEKLEHYTVQRRMFALNHRRVVIACTTGRLLVMHPNLLPGFLMQDIRWQDIRDARLREGIFGSTLTIQAAKEVVVVSGLRKVEAQQVYRFCQLQEQNWREKNRVREMEEMRAKAGGVHIGALPSAAVESSPMDNTKARLQKAKEMLDAGLITDAEYEAAKARVLASL
jgi:PH (Pleckstrin Homology) domain-containing protein/putative oligomerization/nucleic acid binding protein